MTSPDQATVVFADVAGSTGLFETYGDIEARSLTSSALETLMQLVERDGGRVVKTIGDELLSTFSEPDAAVFAAAEMHTGVRSSPALASHDIAIRIGLHHGPVLWEHGDVYGDTVNVAARMASLAKANQIITTREVIDALSPALRLRTRMLETTRVKGRMRPVEVFEVLWQDSAAELTVMPGQIELARMRLPTRLTVEHRGRVMHLENTRPLLSVGRSDDNDVVIDDQLVSRRHARIEMRKDKFVLSDQSTNGTSVAIENAGTFYVHREEFHLHGTGVIRPGRDIYNEAIEPINFRCER